jgi:hypothetical protein
MKIHTPEGIIEKDLTIHRDPELQTLSKISEIRHNRDIKLSEIVHHFNDGRTIQVRPGDISTIELAIAQGTGEDWVMSNNTVSFLTVTELQEALASGISSGKVIWKECTDAIKSL